MKNRDFKNRILRAIILFCVTTNTIIFAEPLQAAQFPWNKIHLAISGGYGNYDMPNGGGTTYANETFNSIWVFDKIGGGSAFSGEIGYDVSRRISLGGAVEYLYGSRVFKNSTQDFLDNYFHRVSPFHGTKFSASILALELKAEYTITFQPLRLSIGPGIAWLQGNASLPYLDYVQAPNFYFIRKHFTASGLGAIISGSASYKLSRILSIRSESGYRFFKTGQLKDNNGNPWTNMRINFSGLYMSAGLLLEL